MNVNIRGTTKVFGIIGDPIHHSFSPLMQNAVFSELGIDAVFIPFHVTPENLSTAVAGLKALAVSGFNVTVPHKTTIFPFLDEVDANAQRIGAVNTVKLYENRLVGYNTDAPGFLKSLHEDLDFAPGGKDVIIIGAGGAARAAICALAQNGVKSLLLVNRTLSRAKELCHEFKEYFPAVDMSINDLSALANATTFPKYDLLVNTSSVGLGGTTFQEISFTTWKMKVYDMVYGAKPTVLVQKSREAGCLAVNGHGMLAAQGELAFRIWLGQDPPKGYMKNCILAACS